MNSPLEDRITLLLRLSAAAVFLGQAWIHLFWDAPFRALLWNQEWIEPWVERLFDLGWEDYAAHSDRPIALAIRATGVLYLIGFMLTWAARPGRRLVAWVLSAGSVSLAFLAFLKYLDHGGQWAQLIEHTAQWTSPLLLVFWLEATGRPAAQRRTEWLVKIAVALTFIGHGVYAVGIHPVPGEFVRMTTVCLGVPESAAFKILTAAGILDFVIAAAVFLPHPRVVIPILGYAAVWGALTSAARTVSHFTPAENAYGLDPWLAESITRLPHVLLPLVLILTVCARSGSRTDDSAPPG